MDEIFDSVIPNQIPNATLLEHKDTSRRTLVILVGVSLVLVFSSAYLIEVFKENNPFAPRPTGDALVAQEVYSELVQIDEQSLDGSGVKVCIVDSGIDPSHRDLSRMNLVAWRDFVNNQQDPYDDQGHGH